MIPKFLLSDYPLEKNYFLVPKFALSIIGFDPESKRCWWRRSWAFFNFVLLGYGCYAELYLGIYFIPIDINTAMDAICPVASSLMSWLKIYFIWLYRDEFDMLIKRLRALTEAQNSPEMIKEKRTLYAIATRLTALVMFFGFCTSTTYSVRPIINISIALDNGQTIAYETPFKMMLPPVALSMPMYPLTFLLVHWHGYVTVCSFVAADGMFLGFCLYLTALLKSLQTDIQRVLGNNSDGPSKCKISPEEELKVCRKLERIIMRHNEVAKLTSQFSGIMAWITLGHFLSSGMIIGTSVIDIMLFPGFGIALYVVYTCAVLTELFLYCLGGDFIMENSEKLAVSAYATNWYMHSVRNQKMVLLVIVRAQRSFNVNVPFFKPSLPTLTSILRFTGSLVALANTLMR